VIKIIEEPKNCPSCGNILDNNANFCKVCGEKIENNLSDLTVETEKVETENQSPKKSSSNKTILIIIAVCCIGIIAVFGAIAIFTPEGISFNFNDEFTKEITVHGETFYLPENYTLLKNETLSNSIYEDYTDGESTITIAYYTSGISFKQLLSNVKNSNYAVFMEENVSYAGHPGFTADYGDGITFFFEKSGTMFYITFDGPNPDEYIPKILGQK
jgi:RNA polymerase subunit RPABC4/transcription elongation factor Spt4